MKKVAIISNIFSGMCISSLFKSLNRNIICLPFYVSVYLLGWFAVISSNVRALVGITITVSGKTIEVF